MSGDADADERKTFGELFPAVKAGWQVPAGYPHLVFKCEGEEEPCWRCGRPTAWVELCFEARTCSPRCDDEAWAEYARALKM